MDLLFCVKDETTSLTEHGSVRTRGSASLIDSLQGALEEPITEKYSLLDRNASWVSTTAKEYKVSIVSVFDTALTYYLTMLHFEALKIYSSGKHCEKRRNCL